MQKPFFPTFNFGVQSSYLLFEDVVDGLSGEEKEEKKESKVTATPPPPGPCTIGITTLTLIENQDTRQAKRLNYVVGCRY